MFKKWFQKTMEPTCGAMTYIIYEEYRALPDHLLHPLVNEMI